VRPSTERATHLAASGVSLRRKPASAPERAPHVLAAPGNDAGHEQEASPDVSELPLVVELTILVLAAFLGFEVISKVPTMLHTPLMSGANFIHGIVIVGAIIVLGGADDTFTKVAGFVAMVLATANVVGGWFVTDRMLGMFKRRPEPKERNE
jgi:NAD(P) transhydrogenase subunit alpha